MAHTHQDADVPVKCSVHAPCVEADEISGGVVPLDGVLMINAAHGSEYQACAPVRSNEPTAMV